MAMCLTVYAAFHFHRVSTPTVVTESKEFSPSISLCKVADCPARCPDVYEVSGGAVYTIGEIIHVTMSLDVSSLHALKIYQVLK